MVIWVGHVLDKKLVGIMRNKKKDANYKKMRQHGLDWPSLFFVIFLLAKYFFGGGNFYDVSRRQYKSFVWTLNESPPKIKNPNLLIILR